MTWLGLAVSRTVLRAVVVARGRPIWMAERPLAGVAELADGIAELVTERPPRVTRTRVVLEGDLVQVKLVVGLPRMPSTRLRAVVALQAGRWFLRNGKPLVTGATWVVPGERALAAAADADTLERVLDGAARAGLTVEAVGPAASTCAAFLPDGSWTWPADHLVESLVVRDGRIGTLRRSADGMGGGEAPLPSPPGLGPDAARLFPAFAAARRRPVPTLEPPALSLRQHAKETRRTAGLAVAALACWLVAAGTFAVRTGRATAAATAELETLAPVVEQALTVEQDIARTEDALRIMAQAQDTRSRDVALLAAVTGALPDAVSLRSLRRDRDGRVTLVGVAPSAARVVTALAGVPGIEAPVLEGGINRDVTPSGVRERFRVAFTWHPKGSPHD